jgi:hypothetical protein
MSTPLNYHANHKPFVVALANRIVGKLTVAADSARANAGTGWLTSDLIHDHRAIEQQAALIT